MAVAVITWRSVVDACVVSLHSFGMNRRTITIEDYTSKVV
jgi:hypothetical protein